MPRLVGEQAKAAASLASEGRPNSSENRRRRPSGAQCFRQHVVRRLHCGLRRPRESFRKSSPLKTRACGSRSARPHPQLSAPSARWPWRRRLACARVRSGAGTRAQIRGRIARGRRSWAARAKEPAREENAASTASSGTPEAAILPPRSNGRWYRASVTASMTMFPGPVSKART